MYCNTKMDAEVGRLTTNVAPISDHLQPLWKYATNISQILCKHLWICSTCICVDRCINTGLEVISLANIYIYISWCCIQMIHYRCYIQMILPDDTSRCPQLGSHMHAFFCITATMHDPHQGGTPCHKHTASSSWVPPSARECRERFDSINFSLASSEPHLSRYICIYVYMYI